MLIKSPKKKGKHSHPYIINDEANVIEKIKSSQILD